MSVRVLIADDHPFVRNGLRSLLREIPDCEVIDEAQDGIDAVEKAIHDKPDVVVLDISMPRMNGLKACRIIRERIPACEVFLESQNDSKEVQRCARKPAARGYAIKSQ